MTENEEFEFRARAELEDEYASMRKRQGAATEAKPSKTYRPSGDSGNFADAGQVLYDTAKSLNSGLKSGIAAMGQMLEKPIAAGVNAVADKMGYAPPMSGQAFTGLAQRAEAERPKDNPVADMTGQTASMLIPMKAAGAFAQGAGALERVGKAGVLGGGMALATEPVVDESKEFAKEKLKQAGRGAAFSMALGGAGEAGRGLYAAGRRFALGIQSEGARKLWDRAKDLGFVIRPEQTRADSARVSQSGLTADDKIANAAAGARMVSEKAGNVSNKLDTAWYDQTSKDLGAKFESVYAPGSRLKVDRNAVDELRTLVNDEHQKGSPFMSRKAMAAANRLIVEFETQAASVGAGRLRSVAVPAELLQDLRTNLRSSATMTSDRLNAHAMQEVIGAIDSSVGRNHPALKAILDDASPKYRTLMTLEHGRQHGFVDKEGSVSLEGLGDFLRKDDKKVVRGTSSHPLAEAGELGETFGIRSIGQSSVAGNRWSGSGAEEFSPTRAGMWRMGVQQAKRLPGVKSEHLDYLKFGGGYRPQNVSPYALSGALIEREVE